MAVGKRDVDFSLKGETKQTTPFEAFEQSHLVDTATPPDVAPSSGRVILKLQDGSGRNGKLYLDGLDDVVNPKTVVIDPKTGKASEGKVERIRLLRGVNTIWMKEQKDLDKDYIQKNRRSLEFVKGVCILESMDHTAIEFAEVSNCSVDNPYRKPGKKHSFFKWDSSKQEKAAMEKEMFEYKVMETAMKQPMDKIRKHAIFLGGVSLFDEYGSPRSDDGIKTLYMRRAKAIPQRFMETVDSKEVEISYLIRKAITDAKIDTGGAGGRIKWANGGGDICVLPRGRAAHEYLLEFALLPQDESKIFLEYLQKTV